ncbi:MAG: homospermidine synthase [Candidatus Staskawiczbacteria bacterium RIFOXYD1_FULL_39_28]|nr:MAG: homospermidine synthase [Candidatus Staskawiczbacteria bacterium RIFOXYD1_FULL_39_28]
MEKIKFDNNILIIGYGAVSQCTLPVILEHIDVPRNKITIIDIEDKSEKLKPFTDTGIKFFQEKITPENLGFVLQKYVPPKRDPAQGGTGPNGMVIDLAWNIGACDILKWCHDHNTLYANTSVELWDPDAPKKIFEKTLYWRQMKLRDMAKKWSKDSVTAVVDHGANPGLISHFVKQGLLDIAGKVLTAKKDTAKNLEKIKEYKNNKDFARLAQILGVKVIHCSERDTQITNRPKEVDEFVNTWSIEGFREEGVAPSEMGWGTHEKKLPDLAFKAPFGPKNQIFLARMGINTWVRSWVPEVGEIEGMIVRHGEAFGISDRLTVWNGQKAVYRPTVHYAYMPCHEALSSLVELKARRYQIQPKLRIMTDEITCGKDILGALLMGHKYNSWWTGTSLSIEQARKIAPGQNATTLQVAAGIISAVRYMIENPKKGICLPDDLPHDFVLNIAKPYLGDFISTASDWTPCKNRKIFFPENKECKADKSTWEFANFLPLP